MEHCHQLTGILPNLYHSSYYTERLFGYPEFQPPSPKQQSVVQMNKSNKSSISVTKGRFDSQSRNESG